jgi:hypothetical protein
MITEKLPKLINRPSLIARQVDEGGIQIGATNEEAGLDDSVTQPGLTNLAAEAFAAFPVLAKAQLGRLAHSVARWPADLSGKRRYAGCLPRDVP